MMAKLRVEFKNMSGANRKTPQAKNRARSRESAFPAKEAEVLKAALRWLEIKRIPHWRMNSGALKDGKGRLVRFGARGMADIHAVGKGGIAVWIECKREKGGRLTGAQKEFLDAVNRAGGVGIVANSALSLEKQLKEKGGAAK